MICSYYDIDSFGCIDERKRREVARRLKERSFKEFDSAAERGLVVPMGNQLN